MATRLNILFFPDFSDRTIVRTSSIPGVNQIKFTSDFKPVFHNLFFVVVQVPFQYVAILNLKGGLFS